MYSSVTPSTYHGERRSRATRAAILVRELGAARARIGRERSLWRHATEVARGWSLRSTCAPFFRCGTHAQGERIHHFGPRELRACIFLELAGSRVVALLVVAPV